MDWRSLDEFPGFEINKFGDVRNSKNKKIRKPLYYKNPVITLKRADGRSTQRSVQGLVDQAFGKE